MPLLLLHQRLPAVQQQVPELFGVRLEKLLTEGGGEVGSAQFDQNHNQLGSQLSRKIVWDEDLGKGGQLLTRFQARHLLAGPWRRKPHLAPLGKRAQPLLMLV